MNNSKNKLLILDEHDSNLDIENKKKIKNILLTKYK